MIFLRRNIWHLIGIAILISVPVICGVLEKPFYLSFATRIVIFAIAALSLDLILGYSGMASFGHAVYIGIGAYAVGILSYHGIDSAFIQWPVALLACAIAATLIGLVSLHCSGVYFLMLTLAFAQMLYLVAFSLKKYGGDDGLMIDSRSLFFGVDMLKNPLVMYAVCATILCVFYLLCRRIVASHFGMVLRGSRSNQARMEVLGFSTRRYRLVAFVISGMMCGIAGVLLANLTEFVAPAYMGWERSGELIVMVVIGGMGTLIGPILGAVAYLGLQELLSTFTLHWQVVIGPLIVLHVLLRRRGFGKLRLLKRPRQRRRALKSTGAQP